MKAHLLVVPIQAMESTLSIKFCGIKAGVALENILRVLSLRFEFILSLVTVLTDPNATLRRQNNSHEPKSVNGPSELENARSHKDKTTGAGSFRSDNNVLTRGLTRPHGLKTILVRKPGK